VLAGLPGECGRSSKKLSEAARLLARGQLQFDDEEPAAQEDEIDHALALLGLYVEGGLTLDADEFWLWPENEPAFLFWMSLQTQWHVGMAGPTGLNYQGVEICMRRRGVRPSERDRMFDLVQVMERAALDEWAKARST